MYCQSISEIYTDSSAVRKSFQNSVKWCWRQITNIKEPLNAEGLINKLKEIIIKVGLLVLGLGLFIPAALISLITIPVDVYDISNQELTLETQPTCQFSLMLQQSQLLPSVELLEAAGLEGSIVKDIQELPVIFHQSLDSVILNSIEVKQQEYEILLEDIRAQGNIQITENLLCEYFSKLPISLVGRKLVVYSKDMGGFGDFIFGFKTCAMLRDRFPDLELALATDNPEKSLYVNGPYDIHVCMPQNGHTEKLSEQEVASNISRLNPDFLIIAPVTRVKREFLESITSKIPHFYLREYGFEGVGLGEDDDFISGAGRDYKGMIFHEDLVRWSRSEEASNKLECLRNLGQLHSKISTEILGSTYSEESIQAFLKEAELFLGYGSDISKKEFLLAVANMHTKLEMKKNLCFVFLGKAFDVKKFLEAHTVDLVELNIRLVEFSDISLQIKEVCEISKSQENIIKIKVVFAQLEPEDVIHLIKASEKECLSTGDQSWSELISAKKYWIQDILLHKRRSLSAVLDLASGTLGDLLKKAHTEKSFQNNGKILNFLDTHCERWKYKAELLFKARTDSNFGRQWDQFNEMIYQEYNIQPWLTGMVIKRYLEQNLEFSIRLKELLSKQSASSQDIIELLSTATLFFNNSICEAGLD